MTAHEQSRFNRDAPADAQAYELYLRGNQAQQGVTGWEPALELYRRSVERDPHFAPAWAKLGRCYRLLGKFGDPAVSSANLARGEQALKRALDINGDLSLAHHLYAYVEVEDGHARAAMVRLLNRVRHVGSDPELFAGLVHACRYCGLLEASAAAYERAHRLDPAVVTSVPQTFLLMGEWERAIAIDRREPSIAKPLALYFLGRSNEAVEILRPFTTRNLHPRLRLAIAVLIAVCEARWDETMSLFRSFAEVDFVDPEGMFQLAGAMALAGDRDSALDLLERCVEAGFYPVSAFASYPSLEPLRATPDFRQIVRRAEERHREALDAFRAAGGPQLLGMLSL